MNTIQIRNACEGNLQSVYVDIPRNQLVVITGLSGSGKSTLAVEVLMHECQRQYLEAMNMQGIHKPKVDSVLHASPSILLSAGSYLKNPRSSVGTITNIYTDLRMLYEKCSMRPCPLCNEILQASQCREEIVKDKDTFTVYQYCPHCHGRFEKLTRTHFSFNTREGACAHCSGLGQVLQVQMEALLQPMYSLENGAVDFWEHRYKAYQIEVVYQAFSYYQLACMRDLPVSSYSNAHMAILLHGVDSAPVRALFPSTIPPKTVKEGHFEGIITTLTRRMQEKQELSKTNARYFTMEVCPTCHGERTATLDGEEFSCPNKMNRDTIQLDFLQKACKVA